MPPENLKEVPVHELIVKCRKRDFHAQRELYNRYSKMVMATCLRYVNVRFEADDVFQETFIKIFQHIDQYNSEGSFDGWLRRIAANTSLKYLKKKSLNFRELDIATLEEQLSVHEDGFKELALQDIQKIIGQLPGGCRIVFNLFAIEGYSHKEIAVMLNVSEGTSKSQFHHARKLLMGKVEKAVI